jgi:hypothetical protein
MCCKLPASARKSCRLILNHLYFVAAVRRGRCWPLRVSLCPVTAIAAHRLRAALPLVLPSLTNGAPWVQHRPRLTAALQ